MNTLGELVETNKYQNLPLRQVAGKNNDVNESSMRVEIRAKIYYKERRKSDIHDGGDPRTSLPSDLTVFSFVQAKKRERSVKANLRSHTLT